MALSELDQHDRRALEEHTVRRTATIRPNPNPSHSLSPTPSPSPNPNPNHNPNLNQVRLTATIGRSLLRVAPRALQLVCRPGQLPAIARVRLSNASEHMPLEWEAIEPPG